LPLTEIRGRFAALLAAGALAGSLPAALPADAAVSRNVTLLSHLDNYVTYSACCRYVHSDGREYAVIGTDTGTSIVNVTNPAAASEVGFIPGVSSIWREMKQYGSYLYISSEGAGAGLQIVSMANPQSPVLVKTYATNFNRAHTVAVDTARALLILNGTRLDAAPAGMRILSLADPANPVEVGSYTADYVHDSWVREDTLYASCISSKTMRIFDFSNPGSLSEIVSWTYPGASTHSAETSSDGRYLYVCDELNYGTMKVFDMLDPFSHPMIREIAVNPLAIVHNVHVTADTAYVAYYTEGVRLFDLADPALPAEWGYYDTYGSFSGGYHGVWEVARFPSGTFVASDIETGLYVFRATPDYGTVTVRVLDEGSIPVPGADVTAVGGSDSTRTQAQGTARLALSPGSHTLMIRKFQYDLAAVPVTVTLGGSVTLEVTLTAPTSGDLSGTVRRSTDLAGLEDATVEDAAQPLAATSTSGGIYALGMTPPGNYTLVCDRPGYVPQERIVSMPEGADLTEDWKLLPAAWYDSCDTNKGWSLSAAGDNASSGLWVRAVPVGTASPAAPVRRRLAPQSPMHPEPGEGEAGMSGPVQPGDDYTPGAGFCFVTGNGAPGGGIGDADVDGGRTTLTTPPLDLASMVEPTIGFRRWYFMNTPGEPDSMLVDISADGTTWARVLTIRESHPEWHHERIRVRDYVAPTSTVRLRFIAQDEGVGGVVEAAIDDLEAHDASLLVASAPAPPSPPPPPAVTLSAPRPNPAAGAAAIWLTLREAGPARVRVFDIRGRLVAVLHDGLAPPGALRVEWDGKDGTGRESASGVYWIRAEAAGETFERRLVRAR
jgi:choice-of-anchor B domain-containing protein